MENFSLIVGSVFILFASAKTYLLIRYFHLFDEVKRQILLPNVLLSSLFVISLILTLKDLENSHKIVVLILTLLGGLFDVMGRKRKNKIMIVLSLLFYMYVIGICWTKSLIFIIPIGA